MADDIEMPDADARQEETLMYGDEDHLDTKFPNRPNNVHKTLPFHSLFTELFDPLLDTQKKARPVNVRRKVGPSGQGNLTPHEARRNIIERYIAKWRKEVGNDFYPAMRLMIPEKDRDRAMYGLKEKAIAKIIIRITKINKDSEDAKQMTNWKLPDQLYKAATSTAGDFARRCFEVLSKRPIRSEVGSMSIAEVNNNLDQLSQVGAEDAQVKIFQRFYRRMNAAEMTWLIRIILRQMKIGATEKTILDIWHPDAEALFNISSSLRRVCWELYDPKVRLGGDDTGIRLMQCFQPQLAAFQPKVGSFEKLVAKLKPEPDDDAFWIEEKLDGERMQLHMVEDPGAPGGKRFGFWSRKAKDYAYLYGIHFVGDEAGALTRFIKDAFHKNVRNIILDGEMITWDMDLDHIVGFGTLKTAALSEKENQSDTKTGQRPLFRVFDCLYFNDTLLTPYTLRDRRKALQSAVKGIPRRLEVHDYIEAQSYTEIEPALRKVIANSSEGLVLKNPRSMYRLNDRNDDWIKVKPEYMSEFGESLDCVIIGGYFGSGHRGGAHSSFLCGLLVNKQAPEGHHEYGKCWSFFKVGGGFSREDYAAVRMRTEGKWKDWDSRRPPPLIELGGHHDNRQHERPDQYIHPADSVVIECKAASVESSDKFRMGITLRFPRFKRLRSDKRWDQALSSEELLDLKSGIEQTVQEKQKDLQIEQSRRKRARIQKKPLVLAGTSTSTPTSTPSPSSSTLVTSSTLFSSLKFYILTDQISPTKLPKQALESLIKLHGGTIVQRDFPDKNLVLIADKRLVKVSSLEKRNIYNILKPIWIHDCIRQYEIDCGRNADADAAAVLPSSLSSYLVPPEPNRHLFYLLDSDLDLYESRIDEYGDAYERDVEHVSELVDILAGMPKKFDGGEFDSTGFLLQLHSHSSLSNLKNYMFAGIKVFFQYSSSQSHSQSRASCVEVDLARYYIQFGGGIIAASEEEEGITHVIISDDEPGSAYGGEGRITGLARRVGVQWIQKCWDEGTRVDEERFRWG